MTVTIFILLWWSGPEPYYLLDVLRISIMMIPILIMKKSKFLIMKKLSNHILHIIADFQTTCSDAKFHAFLHYIMPVCMWYNVLSVTNNRWIFSLSVREELLLLSHLCPTLCNPMDCSPPGSSVHGIFQARVLEWGAIAFSENVTGSNYFKCLWILSYGW